MICKYVDWKGSAAMLAAKRSAGVAPEGNLKNPLYTSKKACKWGIHPGFETQDRGHQKSKTGVSVAPQKGPTIMSSKFFFKNPNVSNDAYFYDLLILIFPAEEIISWGQWAEFNGENGEFK